MRWEDNWRQLRFSDGVVKYVPAEDLLADNVIFDAVIDSELATSVPARHTYKNLTDLVAGEIWASTRRLNVAVKQGPTAISEPGAVSLANKKIALYGVGSGQLDSTPSWLWRGIGGSGMSCFMQGLNINGATASMAVANQGSLEAVGCYFGSNITGFNWAGISGQSGTARDCYFAGAMTGSGSIGVGIVATLLNCYLAGGFTATSQLSLKILGGICAGITISTTSTNSQTVIADLSGGSVTISSGGSVYVQNTATTGSTVTVTATGSFATCSIIGNFGTVAFNAVPSSGYKYSFYGSCDSLTTSGGVHAHATIGTAFVSGRLQVGGLGNMIVAQFNKFTNPAVKFVSATHSQVHCSVRGQGAGSQAYTFDAASTNNILVISGALHADFTTASTDAGSNNRVITESSLGSFPLTSAHIFVGNGSGVATDVAMSGDVSIDNTGATLVNQAHLTDRALPSTPASGTLDMYSFNQQGFSVIHHLDSTGADVEVLRDRLVIVKNTTGATITKGSAVYVSGSSGNVPLVTKAKSDALTTMPAIGLMYADVANNGFGRCLVAGNLESFDTSAFTSGDRLYVSAATAGALTATAPTPYSQHIGTVLVSGVGNGSILVGGRTIKETALADGKVWIGNASGVAVAVTLTGDVTVTNAGVTAIGNGKVLSAMVQTSIALAGSPTTTTQAANDNSTKIATTAYVDTAVGSVTAALTGSIIDYPGYGIPTGYLLCDGSAVSRTTYSALFAVLMRSATITADSTTDQITWTGHGFTANDPVLFTSTGTTPGGVTSGTTYYVRTVVDANTFTLTTAPGGSLLDITSNGTGVITGKFQPWGVGDGSTTFNVPNLTEKRTAGIGTTGTANALAGTGGATTHNHAVGTLANASSVVTGVTGTNASSAVTGVTGTVSAHTHNLSNANAWSQNTYGATAAPQMEMLRVSATSWNETIENSTSVSMTAASTSRSTGAGVSGATESATPTFTYTASSGTAAAQTWTYGASSGTAAAQTISGSTANATGPIDPFVSMKKLIKT